MKSIPYGPQPFGYLSYGVHCEYADNYNKANIKVIIILLPFVNINITNTINNIFLS